MATNRFEADKFLEDITGRYAKSYTAIIQEMVIAKAIKDKVEHRALRIRLEEVIRETMGAAEVLGASLVLQQAAKVIADTGGIMLQRDTPNLLRFADQPILPRVTFDEAVQDMITRTPKTLKNAAERTAQNIAKLYSEGRAVAFVRSAEQAVTERVQDLITQSLREGIPESEIGKHILMGVNDVRTKTAAWSEGYAKMAFRTNVNTAVTAGRFRQVQDPDIKAVIPCFRFDAVGDSDTRAPHDAADGLIFKVDNPVWNTIAPPLDYNCRCQVSLVTIPMLRRMGRVSESGDVREDRLPSTAFPNPAFRQGGRPDLFINGIGGGVI